MKKVNGGYLIDEAELVCRLKIDKDRIPPQRRMAWLTRIQRQTGLRSKDIAALLDVKEQTIRIWRTQEKRAIPVVHLMRLCTLLGFDHKTGFRKDANSAR